MGALVVEAPVGDFAAVGEEEVATRCVERFASVELTADAAPEGFVAEPAERMVGALQLAVFDEGFGEGVMADSGLETDGEQRCGDVTPGWLSWRSTTRAVLTVVRFCIADRFETDQIERVPTNCEVPAV
jgi:hypothetical protein